MTQKLTHNDLLGLSEVVRLGGDLLLLPDQTQIPVEEARDLRVTGVMPLGDASLTRDYLFVEEIQIRYNYERHGDTEPSWIDELPVSVRRYLRLNYALCCEDTFVNVPSRLGAGIFRTAMSYAVTDGGLVSTAYRLFGIWRLDGIKQLGFLQAPHYENYLRRAPLSEASRGTHSLDVMAISTVMAHNVGLDRRRFNTFRTAGLVHDVGTPAGGDSVKMVDFEKLDEDLIFPLIANALPWDSLEPYEVDRPLLIETIQGRGLLSELLDVADKCAYVARDIVNVLHHIEGDTVQEQRPEIQTLLRLLERYPYVCSIWDSVEMVDDHVVFTDTARLVAFLKVRTLMFRELYYHPASRYGEFLMSRLLVKVLYNRGILNPENLRTMNDAGLMRALDEHYGTGTVLDTCSSNYARCEEFYSLEEAQAFRAELQKAGNLFTLLDDNRLAIKTGTHFRVRKNGVVMPLREADPDAARELEVMATRTPMVHVYYLDGEPEIPREKLAQLIRELESLTAS